MASAAAVPRLNQLVLSSSARRRNLPVIQHPMTKMGDRSMLRVTGSASLDTSRPHTVNIATCFSWADDSDFINTSTKKRRYKKKAMATKSQSDEAVLEAVTQSLVDGFHGIKNMFKERYEPGTDAITQESLMKILTTAVGYISKDSFNRVLLNLGLDKKERISFDMFVSRFKEFGDIQKLWSPPVKRTADAQTLSTAHPEEYLRDSEVHEWALLKVAPQATYQLMKALREKKVDLRSILPDECFVPGGLVTKIQLRTALLELGVHLTDLEYKKFWERYDRENTGAVPLKRMYAMLNLTEEGDPRSGPPETRTPILLKAQTGIPARRASKTAREFVLGRHKPRGDPNVVLDGIRGQALQSPASARLAESKSSMGEEGEGDAKEEPAAAAAARNKIRAVMNQRPGGKFDCVVDCLHHKFEERYVSMMMAFKLFDIHEDGCVMRIDFRRVLAEYGFPVTAVQLGALVRRLGVIINHGLISYKQLLSKLMQRTEAQNSQILDDKIQAALKGGAVEAAVTDTDEEAIARKLIESLHHEYIKLALDLLRTDRSNKGVVPVEEMKKSVERCLGFGMTERQWEDFQTKIPYDASGNVRYADFMISFNSGAEPGVWNLLKFGAVTVPRNKVVNEPTEEVKRLERAKTEIPASMVKRHDNRPVDQLRKELKEFFAVHLHDLDKRFKELDRKCHKRFSKWQFGALLKLCGFAMTEKELTDVWLSLKLSDDMMSTFNNVVMEFAPNFTPFHSHQSEDEAGEEEKQAGEDTGDQGGPQELTGGVMKTESPRPVTLSPRTYLSHVMAKAQPAVRKNWEYLRQRFRSHDPHGFGSVTCARMQYLLDSLRCGLTKHERDQICAQFDFKSIGRCNYLAFMKAFAEPPPKEPRLVFNPHRHKLEKKPKDSTKPITVDDALLRIRYKLIKHWKNLRRGFQKNDRSRTGFMNIVDFKRVLAECSVPVSEEDLYHILSEFDANMDGRISYPEFLDALLRTD